MSKTGTVADPKSRSLAEQSKREIWDLRWIREPQQDRSAQTRAQLLDATEQILAKEGLDGLTIAAVASEAGCSVGSLYHHFQDKQTIIYAVLDRLADEAALTAEQGLDLARWEGVSFLGVLEGYLRYAIKGNRKLPGLIQAQQTLALQDPHVESRLHASSQRTRELIMGLLRPRFGEINHQDPNLAASFILSMFRAALMQRSTSYLPGARALAPRQSDESFIREMIRMAAGYLGIEQT
jgi:AcrR family transcriptional regulator